MEPTIDRGDQGGEGRQVQGRGLRPVLDDEVQGHASSRRSARSRRRCRPTWSTKVQGQGEGDPRRQVHGRGGRRPSPSRRRSSASADASTPRPRAGRPGIPGVPRRATCAAMTDTGPAPRRHHQALRRAGRQRRHLARAGARRGAGAARRERRRQVDAGVDPVRPLRRRRRARSRRSAQPLPPGDPAAALAAGIGMVHQHFTLADNLSVLDNVMLGTEPLWRPFSRRARGARKLRRDRRSASACAVDPDARVGDAVGRRAPARRDPQGAVPRRAHPDPRRAHRGADAAGERRRCSPRCAAGRRGPVGHLHQPQARRGAARVATASPCCAAASWSRRWPARGRRQGAARRADGRPRGADADARGRARRGDAVCALDGVTCTAARGRARSTA